MILVTGATGQLGSLIVEELLRRLPVGQIGVSVRDPAKAQHLAELGVSVRRGDFAEPDSLQRAFAGASQILLVSSNAAVHGGDPIAQHAAAIAAAKAAGVQRIVYTSQMAASAHSAFPPMHTHAQTEQMLAESGLAWTALRNGYYAQSALLLLGDVANSGRIDLPADGPVAWTNHVDLAAAAAAVLCEPGRFEGPTPSLTAETSLDLQSLAEMLRDILGKAVVRTVVDDESYASALASRGLPPKVADIYLGTYRAARAGEFARTNPTLAQLLGRPPQGMQQVLEAAFGNRA